MYKDRRVKGTAGTRDLDLPERREEEGSHVSSASLEAPKHALDSYLGTQGELPSAC